MTETRAIPVPIGPRGVMKSSNPLPLTPEELTPDWFSKILGKPVKEVSIVEAIHGTASKILIRLEDGESTDGRTEVCVKGGFNPALVAIHPSLFSVYRLEAEFYYHLGPTLKMLLPEIFYCGTDTVSGQGIVVMADLKGQGNTFGQPLEPWSVARVRAGVEQLAILHARTWGAIPEDFPWFDSTFSLRDVITSMMGKEEWNRQFLGDSKPDVPDHFVDRKRIISAFKTLWRTTDTKMKCIVHGDSHIGNTFITAAGEPGFLDWQGIHVGSAIHDVAYFIVGSLSIEDRRKNEVELFDHYLEILHQQGAPKFEREEVWEEYRKQNLHGFAWALTGPMMQTKESVDVMAKRHCAAIIDHKSLELLEALPEYVVEED